MLLQENGAVKNVVGGARDPTDLFAYGDIDGSGVHARLQHPLGVAVVAGTPPSLLVADSYNHKIKMVRDLDKKTPTCSSLNVSPRLNEPGGIWMDGATVYLADTNHHRILKGELTSDTLVLEEMTFGSEDVLDSSDKVQLRFEVNSGSFSLSFRIPESTHLNAEAPNSWALTLPQDLVSNPVKGEIIQSSTPISITVDRKKGKASFPDFKLVYKMFLCDDNNGTCTVTSKTVSIGVNPESSENHLTISL